MIVGARSTFSPKTTSLFLSPPNLIFFLFSKVFFCRIRFFLEYLMHWICALGDKETPWQLIKKWLQVLWKNVLKKIWSVFLFCVGRLCPLIAVYGKPHFLEEKYLASFHFSSESRSKWSVEFYDMPERQPLARWCMHRAHSIHIPAVSI